MTENEMMNRIKAFRQQAGISQAALADLVGVKRQAVYDMESGRYLPNTGVALKLARHLGCRVEDLFFEAAGPENGPVLMGDAGAEDGARVSVVKVRDRLVAYPVDGRFSFPAGLAPADGVLEKGQIRFFGAVEGTDQALLLGCDPAFSLLAAHASRKDSKLRMAWRFASTHRAMENLAAGKAHLAGVHLHNRPGEEANVALAREKLSRTGAAVMGFSVMEEGLMVARGNPLGIRNVADLTGIRFVNREQGAALRVLLDEFLAEQGIPGTAVPGYETLVHGHNQGAQMIAWGLADAALGLRPVARAFGLSFVPLAEVRCDIVIPKDLADDPRIRIILDVMQSRDFREEISLLPGYSQKKTGATVAVFGAAS